MMERSSPDSKMQLLPDQTGILGHRYAPLTHSYKVWAPA
jgi:hypothetical protein